MTSGALVLLPWYEPKTSERKTYCDIQFSVLPQVCTFSTLHHEFSHSLGPSDGPSNYMSSRGDKVKYYEDYNVPHPALRYYTRAPDEDCLDISVPLMFQVVIHQRDTLSGTFQVGRSL